MHGVVCDEEGKKRIGLRLCIVFAEDEVMRKRFKHDRWRFKSLGVKQVPSTAQIKKEK
jgi:hypothetical protein